MKSSLRVAALGAALAFTPALAVPAEAGAAVAQVAACANTLCTKVRSCYSYRQRETVARCFIIRAADHYRQPRGLALYVAHRESRYNWRVTNRRSGAAGMFQFMPRTWRFTPYGRHGKSPYNPRWASLAAMWMWKHGYRSHWMV